MQKWHILVLCRLEIKIVYTAQPEWGNTMLNLKLTRCLVCVVRRNRSLQRADTDYGYALRIDTHYGYWLMETAQLKSLQIDLCALRIRTTDTHYGYALRTYGKAPLHTSLCIRIRLSKYNCTVLYCRLTWKSLSLMFAFSFWGHFPWLLSGVSPHRWAPGCRKHWGREHVHVLSLLRPA